jgi:hypothetical protein
MLRIERGSGWVENFFRVETPAAAASSWAGTSRAPATCPRCGSTTRPRRQMRYLRFLVLMHQTEFELQRRVDPRGDGRAPGRRLRRRDRAGDGFQRDALDAYRDRWEGVNFSSKKSELGATAIAAFRDRTQAIPPVDGPHKFIATDLYAIQRVTGDEAERGRPGLGGGEKGRKLKLAETENPLTARESL